jgi:heavy metal translocating P-type ATPase
MVTGKVTIVSWLHWELGFPGNKFYHSNKFIIIPVTMVISIALVSNHLIKGFFMLIELTLLSGVSTYWLTYFQDQFRLKKDKRPQPQHINKLGFKQLFKYMMRNALSSDKRQQPLNLGTDNLNEIIQTEQSNINHELLISTGAITAALLGLIWPLFTVLSVASVLYLSRDLFYLVWRDFKAGHFSTFLVGAIMVVGMIASGYFILAALACLLGRLFVRMVTRIEEDSKIKLVNAFAKHPQRVWLEQNGMEIQVYFASIQAGDIVIVDAGEIIPVDGQIREGLATVDQQLLTGERRPVEKCVGDKVFAATRLLSGRIRILVERAGDETVAARIGQMLNQTQNYKDQLFVRGRKMADIFSPIEFGIGVVTWLLRGTEAALTVLWSGFGAHMNYAGPMTVLSYLQVFSRSGILIKDGQVLESLRQVDTVVFDKTNTLTLEQPTVGQIYSLGDWDENTLLSYAAAAKFYQPHPIAKAIVAQANDKNLILPNLDKTGEEVGYDIKVMIEGRSVLVGGAGFMRRNGVELLEVALTIQDRAEEMGCSLIYVSINQQLSGILEIHPTIDPDTVKAIRYLKRRGLQLYLISSDRKPLTQRIAKILGIKYSFAEALPENKIKLIKQLRKKGRFVCFISDGINDAIALKSAQVSVSFRGAATATSDTAQIVLMDGTLNHLKPLFQLTDEFKNSMRTNLITTFIPGMICISGVYFLHFGLPIGMGLYYLGSGAVLSNTLWPLIKHQTRLNGLKD